MLQKLQELETEIADLQTKYGLGRCVNPEKISSDKHDLMFDFMNAVNLNSSRKEAIQLKKKISQKARVCWCRNHLLSVVYKVFCDCEN